ncbi:MAG: DEAD/DEAH box helicase [Nitrospirales bacterium]|nr:MAG: DEAD/DEAH box helicase [Nitrospirales bacterium]
MKSTRTGHHQELGINCAGETLILHSQRAIYRPSTRTLLVADIHLGKEAVFGRAGLAMPYGIHPSNLLRLSQLISWCRPDQLIVLGDLMHTAPGPDETWPNEFLRWLKTYSSMDIAVIAGNHDRMRGRKIFGSQVRWLHEPHVAAPFAYAHEPMSYKGLFTLAGHLHPTYVLASRGDRLRSPVFWFRPDSAVLPAFGAFTGGYNISRIPGDRIFFIGTEEIIEIPPY